MKNVNLVMKTWNVVLYVHSIDNENMQDSCKSIAHLHVNKSICAAEDQLYTLSGAYEVPIGQ